MALGLSKGNGDSGEIIPIIKYNAKAGRVYRMDRIEDQGQWITDEAEITDQFSAVFDMENIEVGWMAFNVGGPPDFQLVMHGEDYGPRPSDKHSLGFRIMLKLAPSIAGSDAVREFSSTAAVVVGAFDALHDAYLAGANQDKLPVVKLGKVKSVTSKYGTNYEPTFIIDKWVARPKDLVFKPRGRGGNGHVETQVSPPATGSSIASPPPAAKDTQWDDFG